MTNAPTLYSDLSHFYDLMCANIHYAEQSEFSHRAFSLFNTLVATNNGNPAATHLDLACGTGPHVAALSALGYSSTGLDLNPAMLLLAQKRCPNAEFSLQDMAEFRFAQEFDLITCFLYSMHYCHPPHKFTQTLAQTYKALAPGGVFIFDAVDKNYIANDNGTTHYHNNETGEFTFKSRWFNTQKNDALELFLTITRTTTLNTKKSVDVWHDKHTMLAITINDIQMHLQRAGFDCFIFERDYDVLNEWKGGSGNVIFVCVKTPPKAHE